MGVYVFTRKSHAGRRVFPPMDFFSHLTVTGLFPRLIYTLPPRHGFLFNYVIGKMALATLSLVPLVHRFSDAASISRSPSIIFVPHQSSGTDRNDAIE